MDFGEVVCVHDANTIITWFDYNELTILRSFSGFSFFNARFSSVFQGGMFMDPTSCPARMKKLRCEALWFPEGGGIQFKFFLKDCFP